ncbi:testis-expressed protein 10 [Ixodes scapularis]
MGKNKKKQKDFQKVKLRVGRKLPQALNTTDTSFKTKKIVLRDRPSKPASGEPTTARKLNIQDLIARLHHYNAASRLDALTGLKELGVSHPETFALHLKALLEILGTTCSDKEGGVRRAALKVLRLVLGSVSADRLSPFGPLLLSHLGCATNHLCPDVRHDALDLLGVLLDCVPALVVRAPYGTLRNFLNMISASAETQSSVPPAKRRRILSSQPGRRTTNRVAWARVLSRLERFLQAALLVNFPSSPLVHSKPPFRLHAGLLSEKSDGTGRAGGREFAEELVPLLLDMWVEADPSSGDAVERDSLVLMDSILSVLLLVAEWLRRENKANVQWFEDSFGKQLLSHFSPRFPYSQDCFPALPSNRKKGKKEPALNRQVSVTAINLGVCEVLAGLAGVQTPDQTPREVSFLRELVGSGQVRSSDVRKVVKITNLLLPRLSARDCRQLAEAMFSLYEDSDILQPKDFQLVLAFFHRLLLKWHSIQEAVRPVLAEFLRSLPRQAVGPAHQCDPGVLSFVGKVAQLRLPEFLEGLQACSLQVIQLLDQLPGEDQQRTVVELVYRVPNLEFAHFEALFAAISSPLPHGTVCYLLDLLLARLPEEKSNGTFMAAYASFLLSLLTGMSKKRGAFVKNIWADDSSLLVLKELLPELCHIPVVPVDCDELADHTQVAERVVTALEAFPGDWDLSQILHPFMERFLETYPQLSCGAALSLLHLAGRRKMLTPPSVVLCVALASSLLCVAASLLSTPATAAAADLIVNVVAAYLVRCQGALGDVLTQLVQLLQIPLSTPCLEVACGSICLLSRYGLLAGSHRAMILAVLNAAKMENVELCHHPWYNATVAELCKADGSQHTAAGAIVYGRHV